MNFAAMLNQKCFMLFSTRMLKQLGLIIFCFLAAIVVTKSLAVLDRWPAQFVIPLKVWITEGFAWFSQVAKPVTRGLAWGLSQPLNLVENLLYRGFRSFKIAPLPWVGVACGMAILGHWIGRAKYALLGGLATIYLAIFGLWADAMKTIALVVVVVPLAAMSGLLLGIAAYRHLKFGKFLNACFDVMQAVPHMAYLGPVIVLFGFGQVPALLATFIFALPPMGRCALLGLCTVAPDIVEAGRMSGCTRRQLLWKVQLPAASQTLLLGLNQVVMQTLAMAVIASLVGAVGLGEKLLFSLQQLQIGKAVEQGIAIVLIAIVLDRMSRALMHRHPQHKMQKHHWRRHTHLLIFALSLAASIIMAYFIPAVLLPTKAMIFGYGGPINDMVRWFSRELFPYMKPIRDGITLAVLLPLRDFYLWLPWPIVIGSLGVIGWRLGGVRLALVPVILLGLMLISGFWTQLMLTVYLVTSATIISVIIGTPLGIWAAKRPFAGAVINTICDTLQTFPSFIYLIPVIMLFQTSDLSNVLAILAYASVPTIRFTQVGLKRVPQATIEAAIASGTTPLQRLLKVELPIAFPELLIGINQTIMMALAMVAITALIGSQDLGQEIYKSLPGADTGRGLLAGLGIAFIGIVADRLIGTWAANINQRSNQTGA